MINFLCMVILVICTLFSAENAIEICSNGVFKCVSATSLQICFRGQLISTEFFCPNTTYCSETADTICTNIADETNEEKTKPETNPDFQCTEVGSFPRANTSCMQYYKCIKKGTGFLLRQLTCYNGYFDPVLKICSASYICPEDCPLEIPVCTTTGKFPIPNTGCKKYVSCNQTEGGWEKQVENCFNRGFFNPAIGRCEKFYICAEISTPDSCTTSVPNGTDVTPTTTDNTTESTVTEPLTTNATITITITDSTMSDSTTESTITNSPIQNSTITESIITDSTTESTITASPITTISVPSTTSIPECTQVGRFPLPNSGCQQYILCIVTSQGFLQQILDCPLNAFFDPVHQRCKTYHICTETTTTPLPPATTTSPPTTITTTTPTTTTTITTTTTTQKTVTTDISTEEPSTPTQEITTTKTTSTESPTHGNCLEQGDFPFPNTNCTKYLHCIVTTNGFLEQILECAPGKKFDPTLKKCSEKYICSEFSSDELSPELDETATNSDSECLHELETKPECSEEGRFPILASCKKYILCVETSTGIKGKVYECPNETNFDPEKRRCETSYQCSEKQCQTTPNIELTTELISTSSETPICLLQGRQEIPGTNCEKFLLCVPTKQGFVSSVYSCPPGSFFNPIKKRCSESYVCPDETNTCSTLGRFPDPMDISCKFYYECTEKEINNIQGILKECEDGHYFNPEIQECSADYICENKLFKEAKDQHVISPRFLVNGQCTTVGRYLVQLSSCKNYVYCSANTDGSLRATNFTCPTTTVFNQAIQKCTSSASYTCPDNVCVNLPGFIAWANPNVKDCTSYITCQLVYNDVGMVIGYSGVINYCQQGTRFNPMAQICDPTYVCPTNNNGK